MFRCWKAVLAFLMMSAAGAAHAAGPVADFSGSYLGLQTGYGFGSAGDWCSCTALPVVTDAVGGEGGFIAAIEAGHDWRIGNFVAELSSRVSHADLAFSDVCQGGLNCSGRMTWLGELQVGAGFVVQDTLVAANAGLAAGTVHAAAGNAPESSDFHSGVIYGVRIEQGVSDQWRFGLEYRFYDMEGSNEIGSGGNTAPVDVSWTSQVLAFAIRYEIGAP